MLFRVTSGHGNQPSRQTELAGGRGIIHVQQYFWRCPCPPGSSADAEFSGDNGETPCPPDPQQHRGVRPFGQRSVLDVPLCSVPDVLVGVYAPEIMINGLALTAVPMFPEAGGQHGGRGQCPHGRAQMLGRLAWVRCGSWAAPHPARSAGRQVAEDDHLQSRRTQEGRAAGREGDELRGAVARHHEPRDEGVPVGAVSPAACGGDLARCPSCG